MSDLIDRSALPRVAVPRAFMQDMLLPYRGRAATTYESSWGEKDARGAKRYRVSLKTPTDWQPQLTTPLKTRKDGTAREARRRLAALGPVHADLLIALLTIDQAMIGGSLAYGNGVPFQTIWRCMHKFGPCGNYSGAWKKKVSRALKDLARCELTFSDSSGESGADRPQEISGPLLSVFWVKKSVRIANREIESEGIERVLWGPAIQHMLDSKLTMTFRVDEYFSIRCSAARVAYLFAPAPAAARARDTQRNLPDGATPSEFSQRSTELLMKLGYSPEEVGDRFSRHRLLAPMQMALDRRPLANGNLSVSLTMNHPPPGVRRDWRLGLRVQDRKPSKAGAVEDVTFIAALEGGRKKDDLYAALRNGLPALDESESNAVALIWSRAMHGKATAWARKVKALMQPADRLLFAEILAEVKGLKAENFRFRKTPAAMVVGLAHTVLRTHEWAHPGRRGAAPPG
jgi:hypothetical protein